MATHTETGVIGGNGESKTRVLYDEDSYSEIYTDDLVPRNGRSSEPHGSSITESQKTDIDTMNSINQQEKDRKVLSSSSDYKVGEDGIGVTKAYITYDDGTQVTEITKEEPIETVKQRSTGGTSTTTLSDDAIYKSTQTITNEPGVGITTVAVDYAVDGSSKTSTTKVTPDHKVVYTDTYYTDPNGENYRVSVDENGIETRTYENGAVTTISPADNNAHDAKGKGNAVDSYNAAGSYGGDHSITEQKGDGTMTTVSSNFSDRAKGISYDPEVEVGAVTGPRSGVKNINEIESGPDV